MKWLKIFISMVQFFTRIPIKFNILLDKQDFGRGLIFAPMVGGIIGAILLGLNEIFQMILPHQIISIFLVITYILITGGLHMDGLGDTFDGIFSNRPKDRILEIMRDSRVGTNAVLAVFSVLLINYAVISSLDPQIIGKVILLMPIAGRIGSLVGAGLHPYARSGEGLGKTFVDYCGKKEIIIGYTIASMLFYLILGVGGILLSFIPLISAIFTSTFFAKKINGITGDVLGAVCELNQTIFLISFSILYTTELIPNLI